MHGSKVKISNPHNSLTKQMLSTALLHRIRKMSDTKWIVYDSGECTKRTTLFALKSCGGEIHNYGTELLAKQSSLTHSRCNYNDITQRKRQKKFSARYAVKPRIN